LTKLKLSFLDDLLVEDLKSLILDTHKSELFYTCWLYWETTHPIYRAWCHGRRRRAFCSDRTEVSTRSATRLRRSSRSWWRTRITRDGSTSGASRWGCTINRCAAFNQDFLAYTLILINGLWIRNKTFFVLLLFMWTAIVISVLLTLLR